MFYKQCFISLQGFWRPFIQSVLLGYWGFGNALDSVLLGNGGFGNALYSLLLGYGGVGDALYRVSY